MEKDNIVIVEHFPIPPKLTNFYHKKCFNRFGGVQVSLESINKFIKEGERTVEFEAFNVDDFISNNDGKMVSCSQCNKWIQE